MKKSLDDIIADLNAALVTDAHSLDCLFGTRVPCTEQLGNNSPYFVQGSDGQYTVSALGIINGILEDIYGDRIASKWKEGKLIGFMRYSSAERIARDKQYEQLGNNIPI